MTVPLIVIELFVPYRSRFLCPYPDVLGAVETAVLSLEISDEEAEPTHSPCQTDVKKEWEQGQIASSL